MIRVFVGRASLKHSYDRRFTFPEAELHPRKQVAWAEWLVKKWLTDRRQKYIVETYSDYILNVINAHLSRGTLPFDSVEAFDEGCKLLRPLTEQGSYSFPSIEEELEYIEELEHSEEVPEHEQWPDPWEDQ